MHTNFDRAWKGIIEDLVFDFLLFFYPELSDTLDYSKAPQFLEQEFHALFKDENSTRYVDKLIKVFTKTGEEKWFLVHVEIQSKVDVKIPIRMFNYYYRIFDKYQKELTSLVIYTDQLRTNQESYYLHQFLDTTIFFEFKSFFVEEQDDMLLTMMENPFAKIILIAKNANAIREKADEIKLKLGVELCRKINLKETESYKLKKIILFIQQLIKFQNPEKSSIFEADIKNLNKETKLMGLEELIREDARMEGELIGIEKGKEIGMEKGKEIGMEKGKEIGMEKGKEIGMEKGMEKSRLNMLEALLKEKLDRDMICRIIGVDNKTLDGLIEKLNSNHQN